MTRALVLGGGGLAGIAWELGLLVGLAEQGVDLASADLVVGTSAGSVVGALLCTGADLSELLQVQAAPGPGGELAAAFDSGAMLMAFGAALAGARGEQDARARIGVLALATPTVDEQERRDVIAGRLPSHDWPSRRLLITAVDASTGEFLALDASAGLSLVDAVAASCAVPGVWPPASALGRRLMDGGMRSITNADLAAGAERTLVLAPFRGFPTNPLGPTLDAEVALLRAQGDALVVEADGGALAAFGANPLDPATRAPSAAAGRRQAGLVVDQVRALWDGSPPGRNGAVPSGSG